MRREEKAETTSDIAHPRRLFAIHGTLSLGHKILHVLFLTFFTAFTVPPPLVGFLSSYELSSTSMTVFTASSKTRSTPRISLLLHSTYVAPIRVATACPCSGVTGVRPCVLRRSMHVFFDLRSDFRPTRINGVVGQK
jgi:hypothetical protein